MKKINKGAFCLVYAPNLTTLDYPDDLTIRSKFNDRLSQQLKTLLDDHEKIYSISGHGLLIKLNDSSDEKSLLIYKIANSYQYSRSNCQINLHCGVSYTTGNIVSKNASIIFDLLSQKIHLSIENQRPEKISLDENEWKNR